MIKDFTPRLYQQTILGSAVRNNTLVVLPTGLGKTALAFLLTAQRLTIYPDSKILMLAPTKPLCEQHVGSFRKYLNIDPEKVALFTGSVKPEKRAALFKQAQIIISTPQGIENDVINKRIKLENISLLIIDEAHHATGDYAYVWVAKQYERHAKHSRILALTASPGADLEKIKEVTQNLHIEKIEVRTQKDPDVKPYMQKVEQNYLEIPFPENFKELQKMLKNCIKAKLIEVKNLGYCNNIDATKGELLKIQAELRKRISSGEREYEAMIAISLLAQALKVEHALELLESQGLSPLSEYIEQIFASASSSKTKAIKNLVIDEQFKSARYLTQELIKKNILHPKVIMLKEMLTHATKEDEQTKIIIFTQFRDTAEQIIKSLEEENISCHIFVGQAKKKGVGFSQKKQKEVLDQFRNSEFNVLVATSVAEEGLDIPKVDQVIFYEPVPSAIRSIQRRGRTGRLETGKVSVLVTKGTRDEGYRWSAHHKEKRMYKNLESLKKKAPTLVEKKEQQSLTTFIPKEKSVLVLADHREKDNKVVKELIELGASVKTEQLTSADYIVAGNIGVELKKVPDFVDSLIDGRLLTQLKELRTNFAKAVLIIEGEQDIYAQRNIHANSIRGMLSSIALDFHIPVLYSKNPQDTAALLASMASQQQDKSRSYILHPQKQTSGKDALEYVIASMPGIGPLQAKKLLTEFTTIKNVINASQEQLEQIDGIGPKTAKRIKDTVEKTYKK